jgi:hypothetical protein
MITALYNNLSFTFNHLPPPSGGQGRQEKGKLKSPKLKLLSNLNLIHVFEANNMILQITTVR